MSYITYNLELFCDANTPILLVPCHLHKQKLNEKKHNALFIYVIFLNFKVVFKMKNKIIMLLCLRNKNKTWLMNDIH